MFYTVLLYLQNIHITYCIIFVMCIMLIIGLCTYSDALTQDLKVVVANLDKKEKNENLAMTMRQTIDLQNSIVMLNNSTQNILSKSLFALFAIFVVMVSFSILTLDQGIHDLSPEILLGLQDLLLQIALNYIVCKSAERLNSMSFEVTKIFYHSHWYQLPINMQKMFIFMIRQAQTPFNLRGLNFFTCCLEQFSKLIRTSISYYLLLRQFREFS
ncbi:odorant receptor 9a-like [Sitodiplosis mosellana]|uniref:odorant receptor 9a-like n=1 Tax=Sitodiplosis mosellana TaxID=263140 RepID=UPI0024450405|nr:odorant receptor 9a-like [Sitodiplosis mosellana]